MKIDDPLVRLWDTDTGKELDRFTPSQRNNAGVAFSSGGEPLCVTGESGGTARVWNVETGEEIHRFSNLYLEEGNTVLSRTAGAP